MAAKFISDTPPYAELEREMQRIPGFQPRRSGMVISHLSGKICKNKACVYEDILHEFMAEVIEGPFMERAESLSCRLQPLFSEEGHNSRFQKCWGIREQNVDKDAWCGALYLLTADKNLWKGAEGAVKPDFIDFPSVSVRGVDRDGYVLYHTAKDLYRGTIHISLADLTDGELVSDRAFRLLLNAFLVCRYGPHILLQEIEEGNGMGNGNV